MAQLSEAVQQTVDSLRQSSQVVDGLNQAASGMRPDLKIVHTSGYPKGAMVHQDEPRFRQGFIIMKPYRREELQKIIRDAFEKQS